MIVFPDSPFRIPLWGTVTFTRCGKHMLEVKVLEYVFDHRLPIPVLVCHVWEMSHGVPHPMTFMRDTPNPCPHLQKRAKLRQSDIADCHASKFDKLNESAKWGWGHARSAQQESDYSNPQTVRGQYRLRCEQFGIGKFDLLSGVGFPQTKGSYHVSLPGTFRPWCSLPQIWCVSNQHKIMLGP